MFLEFLVPKKFLCYYSLNTGAQFVGIYKYPHKGFIALLTGVTILTQAAATYGAQCDRFVWRTAYGFGVTTTIYNVLMIFINMWLVWATQEKKATVLLVWVVIATVWLIQIFLLIVVLVYIHELEVSRFAGTVCLILGLIIFVVFSYFILVVYGHWMELRKRKSVAFASSIKT